MDGLTIRGHTVPSSVLLGYVRKTMPKEVDANKVVYRFWGLNTREAGGYTLEKAREFFATHGEKVKPPRQRKNSKSIHLAMPTRHSFAPHVITVDPQGIIDKPHP
jgi:hypothetical protein